MYCTTEPGSTTTADQWALLSSHGKFLGAEYKNLLGGLLRRLTGDISLADLLDLMPSSGLI